VTRIVEEDYEQELFKDVCNTAMELCVNLGLFTTISSHWPEEVRRNWEQRMKEINEMLHGQIEEVQSFAEAFDG
jgi:hypothetical protein